MHESRELFEIDGIQVRHGPILQAPLCPLHHVKTISLELPWIGMLLVARRPTEEVDDMFSSAIDQRRDRPTIDIIQPPSDKREAIRGKVNDVW